MSERLMVVLDSETARQVREVANGNVSAWLARAVQRELFRDSARRYREWHQQSEDREEVDRWVASRDRDQQQELDSLGPEFRW